MSSPISTTDGSLPSMMSMAEFKACIMFMLAMPSTPFRTHQRPLPFEMLRHLLEHVLEHQIGIEPRTVGHRAEGDCFLPARADQCIEFLAQRLMTLLGPFAQCDQVLFEPLDRIAQGPMFLIVLGAVAGRIVAGRVSRGAIGHQF